MTIAVERRVKICRILCNMQKYPEYSNKLGLVDRSKVKNELITEKEVLKND